MKKMKDFHTFLCSGRAYITLEPALKHSVEVPYGSIRTQGLKGRGLVHLQCSLSSYGNYTF